MCAVHEARERARWASRLRSVVRKRGGSGLALLFAATLIATDCRRAQPPSERCATLTALAARPNDPRPRGRGHVVLAIPGTRLEDKGYLEPGGSFSPGFGSFGLSFWVLDERGELKTTSDAIDLAQIRQRLSISPRSLPSIETDTNYYTATWTAREPGCFGLALRPTLRGGRVAIAVRSTGPAGGPVRDLERAGDALIVNRRFRLEATTAPEIVRIGREPKSPDPSWRTLRDGPSAISVNDGWGYALLAWPAGRAVELVVRDTHPVAEVPVDLGGVGAPPRLELPDDRFVQSLQAQVAHILMSTVGRETRPGEPANYPLEWLRDGAYEIAALARAGRSDAARGLLGSFMEKDFFGGFGAEGDGPGFAIWAISEVIRATGDRELERAAYPHVHRKAEIIGRLLHARTAFRYEPVGQIVPQYRAARDVDLVAEPATGGLIRGRMDWGRPELFIGAISYLGLRRAAELARRMGDHGAVERWTGWASALQEAWERAFPTLHRKNERAFISGMHPSEIAAHRREAYLAGLEWSWAQRRTPEGGYETTPMWTYFELADAHQWLLLGRPERTWRTLEYFFSHQASPGLFTWWEGDGEENASGLWEGARGWLAPPHVTPHYWTAAEMLLLQLSILATTDESTDPPTWIIGAGVPSHWLGHDLSVAGVRTAIGTVDFRWNRTELVVKVRGPRGPVRAGPAFPAGTPIRASFEDERQEVTR